MLGEGWDLEVFADVRESGKRRNLTPNQAFAILAAEMQPKLTLVLRWVADPNRMSRENRLNCARFPNGVQRATGAIHLRSERRL